MHFGLQYQWRIQDFPDGGANPWGGFFAEKCIKMGARIPSTPLDPQMSIYTYMPH